MARHRKRMPAWVIGFVLAVVIFVVVLLVLNALGYGDDPVLESLGIG